MKNEESIVRQSTLKLMIEYSKLIGVPMDLKTMVGVTNVLVDYCQNGYSKEIGNRLQQVDKHLQEVFLQNVVTLAEK